SKAGFVSRLAASELRIPVVHTAHGWGFKRGVPPVRRAVVYLAELLLSRSAAATICVSAHDFSLARRSLRIPSDRLYLVRNGIQDSDLRASPATSPVTIAMVARFQHPKNHAFALRVLKKAVAPAQLVFVGDGPTKDSVMRMVAEDPLLRDRVSFLGERRDVP